MAEEDRRKSRRIPAEDLVPLLRKFKIMIGESMELTALTIDAGARGISLVVPINVFAVKDYCVTLYTLDGSFSITDDIVYIKAITPKSSRISIMFSSTTNLAGYERLLKESE